MMPVYTPCTTINDQSQEVVPVMLFKDETILDISDYVIFEGGAIDAKAQEMPRAALHRHPFYFTPYFMFDVKDALADLRRHKAFIAALVDTKNVNNQEIDDEDDDGLKPAPYVISGPTVKVAPGVSLHLRLYLAGEHRLDGQTVTLGAELIPEDEVKQPVCISIEATMLKDYKENPNQKVHWGYREHVFSREEPRCASCPLRLHSELLSNANNNNTDDLKDGRVLVRFAVAGRVNRDPVNAVATLFPECPPNDSPGRWRRRPALQLWSEDKDAWEDALKLAESSDILSDNDKPLKIAASVRTLGRQGYRNRATECYRLATFQAMASFPEFMRALLHLPASPERLHASRTIIPDDQKLMLYFQACLVLLLDQGSAQDALYTTPFIFPNEKKSYPQQQDASEFLFMSLSKVNEFLESYYKRSPEELSSLPAEELKTPEDREVVEEAYWPPLFKAFRQQFRITTRCFRHQYGDLTGGSVNRIESFAAFGLTLGFSKDGFSREHYYHSLEQTLNNYFYPEWLDVKYDGHRGAWRKISLRNFGPILIVPLLRMGFDMQGGATKMFHSVSYPPYLDLAECFEQGANLEHPPDYYRYELRAVVVHYGVNVQAGHYYTYVRLNHGADCYLFNDNRVYKVPEAEVFDPLYGNQTPDKTHNMQGANAETGYILYYHRVSEKETPLSYDEPGLISTEVKDLVASCPRSEVEMVKNNLYNQQTNPYPYIINLYDHNLKKGLESLKNVPCRLTLKQLIEKIVRERYAQEPDPSILEFFAFEDFLSVKPGVNLKLLAQAEDPTEIIGDSKWTVRRLTKDNSSPNERQLYIMIFKPPSPWTPIDRLENITINMPFASSKPTIRIIDRRQLTNEGDLHAADIARILQEQSDDNKSTTAVSFDENSKFSAIARLPQSLVFPLMWPIRLASSVKLASFEVFEGSSYEENRGLMLQSIVLGLMCSLAVFMVFLIWNRWRVAYDTRPKLQQQEN